MGTPFIDVILLSLLSGCILSHGGGAHASSSCTDCTSANVICVDGECLSRCVIVTSSGECQECRDRFYGKQCEGNCPTACLNFRCHLHNSRVVCSDGCIEGKKGDKCEVNCHKGCTRCDRYGNNCLGPCRSGYYGTRCENECSPQCKDSCMKENGICLECKCGYKGEYCDQPCPSPSPDFCCRRETGLSSGSPMRTTTVTQQTRTVIAVTDQQNMTLPITCAVLGTLLGTLALVFVYRKCTKHSFCIRRRNRNRESIGMDQRENYLEVTQERTVSTGRSSSGMYMWRKYWDIKDEDLDSSIQEGNGQSDNEVLSFSVSNDGHAGVAASQCEDN